MKRSRGKIFIHHDGALGDVLLSLPSIQRIRESVSAVHIAARNEIAGFLLSAGAADEISFSDSSLFGSLYMDSPDEPVKRFLSSFDSAYVFTVNAASTLCGNIRNIVCDTKTIITIPPQGSSVHISIYRLVQCGFGPQEARGAQMLRIPNAQNKWANDLMDNYGFRQGRDLLIAIHPGSGGKRKCWPLHHYEALIKMLTRQPRFVVLVFSGPAEDQKTEYLLSGLEMHTERIIHLHNEPLIRVASLIARSDFYLGNDSGISHLAGILKCRGIVLFGPTDPSLWRPLGDSLEVLRFDAGELAHSVSEESIFHKITPFSHHGDAV
jgi:hypothetical protein